MPLYEYRCRSCDHRFEILQRLGENGDGLACPRCGAAAPAKQFSTFAGIAGGSGSAAQQAAAAACSCGKSAGFG